MFISQTNKNLSFKAFSAILNPNRQIELPRHHNFPIKEVFPAEHDFAWAMAINAPGARRDLDTELVPEKNGTITMHCDSKTDDNSYEKSLKSLFVTYGIKIINTD